MQKRITTLTSEYRVLNKVSGLPSKLERAKFSGYKRKSVKSFWHFFLFIL